MNESDDKYLSQASEHWRNGRVLEAGRLIFENIPKHARAGWAANILESVVRRTGSKPAPIENILLIAKRASDWGKAHEAFSIARKSTLALEKLPSRSTEQTLLLKQLVLAELVAKVIYNSTDPSDEFDEDSGWWIAVCLKEIVDLLGDDNFSRLMWCSLCGEK